MQLCGATGFVNNTNERWTLLCVNVSTCTASTNMPYNMRIENDANRTYRQQTTLYENVPI